MHDHGVTWADAPADHDYPAATDYLTLISAPDVAERLVAELRAAPPARRKAKDLLRAAGLELLPEDDPHVAADLDKIKAGHPLSPVFVVIGDMTRGLTAQIADGYHRVCASHHVDPNTDVACRLVHLDGSPPASPRTG